MSLKKCVGYLRRSDVKQGDNHSLEIQRREIERAAERNGYEVVEWFTDDAKSAYHHRSKDRRGMQELYRTVLEDVLITAVFFYDESRVSRLNVDFVLEITRPLIAQRPDVKFYSASDFGDHEWDPNSPQIQMRLTFAMEESATKSRRSKDAQGTILNQEKPVRPGSKEPYGYTKGPNSKALVPDMNSAPIVFLIFHLASWGQSSTAIAEYLNCSKIPSPKKGEWGPTTIDSILDNQTYLGDLRWNVRTTPAFGSKKKVGGQMSLFQGTHPAIVPRYLWDMAHCFRDYKRSTHQKVNTPYLVQGLAKCKDCKVPLEVLDRSPSTARGKYVKYRCKGCGATIHPQVLHDAVIERVCAEWGLQSRKFAKEAKKLLKSWIAQLDNEREKCSTDIVLAKQALAANTSNTTLVSAFQRTLTYTENKLKSAIELQNRVSELCNDDGLERMFGRFHVEVFEKLSAAEKRAFLMMTVASVTVDIKKRVRVTLDFRVSPFLALDDEITALTKPNK